MHIDDCMDPSAIVMIGEFDLVLRDTIVKLLPPLDQYYYDRSIDCYLLIETVAISSFCGLNALLKLRLRFNHQQRHTW